LPGDLTRVGTTPAFSWISPNLCDDGHDAPCVTGGLAQADAFLAQWVPKIRRCTPSGIGYSQSCYKASLLMAYRWDGC
jgi:hypothetical protein